MAKDVVGPDLSQQDAFLDVLKGDSVVLRDPHFPNIGGSFKFFDVEGGMASVSEKSLQRIRRAVLDVGGEFLEHLLEVTASKELDQVRRSFIRSFTLLNPLTRPLRISSSASCSPTCHSLVQKYA